MSDSPGLLNGVEDGSWAPFLLGRMFLLLFLPLLQTFKLSHNNSEL